MRTVRTLTVAEAATTAGCNPETIRRAIRRKELLAKREATKRGRGYIILATDLKAFLDRRAVG